MRILHEHDERNQSSGQTVSRPHGSQPDRASRPEAEEATRAQLVHVVEAAKRELEIELAALRRGDPANLNLSAMERGETKLRQLDALLDRLANAPPGAILAALRAEVGTAVGASSGVATQTASAASFTASYTMAQISISQAEYQRATAELDRKVAQSYAAEAGHLAYAHDTAKRYGIDISGFTHERKGLEGERDEAKKKGDKLAERMADALIAHNTFNTLATELDHIKDPEARRKHLDEMRAEQKIIDERREALAAQVELDARRAATEKNLPPDQAKAFIDDFRKQKLQEFDGRTKTLKGADKAEAARALLETARRAANSADLATVTSPAETPAIADSLSPDARAKAQEAGASIHSAYGKTSGAVDDFALAPDAPPAHAGRDSAVQPARSKITLATDPAAHNKVETPKTPTADNDKGRSATR